MVLVAGPCGAEHLAKQVWARDQPAREVAQERAVNRARAARRVPVRIELDLEAAAQRTRQAGRQLKRARRWTEGEARDVDRIAQRVLAQPVGIEPDAPA